MVILRSRLLERCPAPLPAAYILMDKRTVYGLRIVDSGIAYACKPRYVLRQSSISMRIDVDLLARIDAILSTIGRQEYRLEGYVINRLR